MTRSILMVGCGNMGGALLARWIGIEETTYTVLDPGDPKIPGGIEHVASAEALSGHTFDAIVLAVKPQLAPDAMPPLSSHLQPGGCVISIAAGLSSEAISDMMYGAPVIRLMPNMPARIGMGVSGLFAQKTCGPEHRNLAEQLGSAAGSTVWLESEESIDRITAAAGSGPGYVFEFARTYQNAVEALGFQPEDARKLVTETMLGSMKLALDEAESFEKLRDSIMSRGGTTAAGVSALNSDGELGRRIESAVSAAHNRAVELSA